MVSGEDRYYHLVLLAENLTGYQNLIKIVSKGFVDGFYYRPENLLILKSRLFSLLIQPPLQITLNFSGQASAEADNSFMVLCERSPG